MREKETLAGKLAVWSFGLIVGAIVVIPLLFATGGLIRPSVSPSLLSDILGLTLWAAVYVAPPLSFLLGIAALCIRTEGGRSPSLELAKAALVISVAVIAVELVFLR